ncbi:MAG: hypothetical protein H6581_20595 [Bacteroidia bacterium]|nr:hypothetical protein [Bacteroidia bacterium]
MEKTTELLLLINSGLLVLIGILSGIVAFWLRNLFQEFKEAMKTITQLGKDVAVTKVKLENLDQEVDRLNSQVFKGTKIKSA